VSVPRPQQSVTTRSRHVLIKNSTKNETTTTNSTVINVVDFYKTSSVKKDFIESTVNTKSAQEDTKTTVKAARIVRTRSSKAASIQVEKTIDENEDLAVKTDFSFKSRKSASSNELELNLDEDDDDAGRNVKKFKFISKKEPPVVVAESTATMGTSQKPTLALKNKIFNFKNRNADQPETNGSWSSVNKSHSFKLNFNDDTETVNSSESLDNEEKTSINGVKSSSGQSSLNKSSSLKDETSSSRSGLLSVKSSSFCDDTSKKDEVSLRNTRKAYECEELGEAQAFLDDFNYLVEGISCEYKLSERCLSLIKLAEQCLSSEFRMNLRSSVSSDDYYLNKLFRLLNDSTKYKVTKSPFT
jgi:hypothetical protein